MKRREFIAGLGSAAAWPIAAARAQQPAMPVIGFLDGNSPEGAAQLVAAFRKGLSEKNYVEGSNVRIEYRFANNDFSRYRELASDLVRRRVTVIAIGASGPAARAAKDATATIPIVFGTAGDPVQEGLVERLNRPGGNVTGFTNLAAELTAKRFGLVHQLLPGAVRFAILVNNALNPNGAVEVTRVAREAASAIDKPIEIASVSTSREIEVALASLADAKTDALVVPASPLFTTRRIQLITLATHYKMPAIYYDRPFTEAGGLLSYGASLADQGRQVGVYVGRILDGEKPGDLPVVQLTKFELVINLQTARLLGIDVPPMLLAIADEVIE